MQITVVFAESRMTFWILALFPKDHCYLDNVTLASSYIKSNENRNQEQQVSSISYAACKGATKQLNNGQSNEKIPMYSIFRHFNFIVDHFGCKALENPKDS